MGNQSTFYNGIAFCIAMLYAVRHIDVATMFSTVSAFSYQFINFALYFAAIFIGIKLLFKLVQFIQKRVTMQNNAA